MQKQYSQLKSDAQNQLNVKPKHIIIFENHPNIVWDFINIYDELIIMIDDSNTDTEYLVISADDNTPWHFKAGLFCSKIDFDKVRKMIKLKNFK